MITKRKLKKMMSVLFISGCFFIGNTKCKGADLEYISQETANYAVQERGYDLPVDEVVKEEAIEDCKNVMNQMKVIYQKADKGTSSNIVVSETVMEEMQEVLKEKNVPVIASAPYSNMANYSKMEEFLFRAEQDLTGDIVLYRINRDGGIERLKFNYDGTDMYLLAVKAVWGMNDNPSIVYVSYTRIEEWKYTEKGWFGYTLCVPKYPEVSEAVDGSSMIRIKPLSDECREVSKRCVYLLGYQGNNLLYAFSDVDRDPRYRVVSIAYYALVRWEDCKVKAGDDADRAQWFPLSGIPPLAFDHRRILQMAADRLKLKARYRPIGIDLLPPEFKMADLRHLYESVLQCTLDRDNFRRKMVGTGLLVDAEQENRAKNGRKVRYYRFDRVKYRYFTEKGFYLKWE